MVKDVSHSMERDKQGTSALFKFALLAARQEEVSDKKRLEQISRGIRNHQVELTSCEKKKRGRKRSVLDDETQLKERLSRRDQKYADKVSMLTANPLGTLIDFSEFSTSWPTNQRCLTSLGTALQQSYLEQATIVPSARRKYRKRRKTE